MELNRDRNGELLLNEFKTKMDPKDLRHAIVEVTPENSIAKVTNSSDPGYAALFSWKEQMDGSYVVDAPSKKSKDELKKILDLIFWKRSPLLQDLALEASPERQTIGIGSKVVSTLHALVYEQAEGRVGTVTNINLGMVYATYPATPAQIKLSKVYTTQQVRLATAEEIARAEKITEV